MSRRKAGVKSGLLISEGQNHRSEDRPLQLKSPAASTGDGVKPKEKNAVKKEGEDSSLRRVIRRDAKNASDGGGSRAKSGGFLEFDFGGVAEGVEDAGGKRKLEIGK